MYRKIGFTLTLTLAVCFGCCNAWGVGKITTDPNASNPPSTEVSMGNDDARLSQKISYCATHKSVLSILTNLSDISKVKLRAGLNNNDWQVRDRRMNIYAKDTTLADLMNSIASVMKFTWSKNSESNPPSYRLYMKRADVIAVENKALAEAQKYTEKKEAILEKLDDASEVSPDALDKLKNDNPYLYAQTVSGAYNALKDFFGAYPPAKEAFLSGQEVSIAAVTLPEAARNALYELLSANWKINPMADGDFPEGEANNFAFKTLVIEGANSRLQYRGVYKTASGDLNGMMMNANIYDPSSDKAKVQGLCQIAALEGKSREEIFAEFDIIHDKVRIESTARQSGDSDKSSSTSDTEPLKDDFITSSSDDPALKKLVEFMIDSNTDHCGLLSDYLKAIADISGFAVVSDSFPNAEYRANFPKNELEVKQIIDKIALENSYKWKKHNGVIEFRDNDWYKKRSLQIPDAWLNEWKNECINTGTLDIKSLTEISALTKEQFDFNFHNDEVLRCVLIRYPDADMNAFMEFYNALDNDKLRVASSKSGLDINILNQDEMSKLTKMIGIGANSWILERMKKYPDKIMLRLDRQLPSSGHSITYRFLGLIPWLFTIDYVPSPGVNFGYLFTPEYIKPKPDKQLMNNQ
ncbi:MAG: hypothetical protein ABFD54_10015 [Armatimonadota bacterium]|nr:hypothetical protein [bacterium]